VSYDASALQFVGLDPRGFAGEQMSFCSAQAFPDSGTIHIGGVVDYHLVHSLPPDSHRIGLLRFVPLPGMGNQAKGSRQVAVSVNRGLLIDPSLEATPIRTASGGAVTLSPKGGSANERPARLSIPNPYAVNTQFTVPVIAQADVAVQVFDVQGRLVRQLYRGQASAPGPTLAWDGRTDGGQRARSGLYWVRVRTGSKVQRKKLVLVK